MTKTGIALNAIRGTRPATDAHITIIETMRTLKLTTEEAAELRRMVGREWRASVATNGYDAPITEVLDLAKDVTNQYARDYRLR